MNFNDTNNDVYDRADECRPEGIGYNLVTDTDSYKQSHFAQYPKNTQTVYSYLESRGGDYNEVVFFGLQYILKEYLTRTVTIKDVNEAERKCKKHRVPFNREGWLHILKEHGGKLPLRIKAVPEGSVIPVGNVLMTIENTDPKCYWLTNFMETLLLRVWYPITVSTLSRECKKLIMLSMLKTCDTLDKLIYMLHDFGSRGVSCQEQAGIGGLAHLVNFVGTDTMRALDFAEYYYDCDEAGYSIPASEHSTMTPYGQEHEIDAYRNMIETYKGVGIFSCVSDSYDIFNACSNIWGGVLKQEVIDSGCVTVIRPDSGDPVKTPVECILLLGEKFGYEVNKKGYKVLCNNVRVIQGDGIDIKDIKSILDLMESHKLSTDNIAFGMGGGLLMKLNRDTQKFAIKCSAIDIDGVWHEVHKDPVGQPDKKSKRGKLILTKLDDEFVTIECADMVEYIMRTQMHEDILTTIFENGIIKKEYNLEEVRERVNNG